MNSFLTGRLSPIKEESCLKQETMDGSKLAANSTFSYSWAVEKTIQDDPGMKAGLQSTTPGSSSRWVHILVQKQLIMSDSILGRNFVERRSGCCLVILHLLA